MGPTPAASTAPCGRTTSPPVSSEWCFRRPHLAVADSAGSLVLAWRLGGRAGTARAGGAGGSGAWGALPRSRQPHLQMRKQTPSGSTPTPRPTSLPAEVGVLRGSGSHGQGPTLAPRGQERREGAGVYPPFPSLFSEPQFPGEKWRKQRAHGVEGADPGGTSHPVPYTLG